MAHAIPIAFVAFDETRDKFAGEAPDVVTAGFPCTDISGAGRGTGITKETRSGRWLTIADAIRLLQPGHVIAANACSSMLPTPSARDCRGPTLQRTDGPPDAV
ncbi:DNA cytosine methyltransferase [Streptosporangiaceae bacterium NEAU-GS5]|nr:DNA cytosine methyltransferase [Streptosporangiaceae bacterium NEAU-GS5]